MAATVTATATPTATAAAATEPETVSGNNNTRQLSSVNFPTVHNPIAEAEDGKEPSPIFNVKTK